MKTPLLIVGAAAALLLALPLQSVHGVTTISTIEYDGCGGSPLADGVSPVDECRGNGYTYGDAGAVRSYKDYCSRDGAYIYVVEYLGRDCHSTNVTRVQRAATGICGRETAGVTRTCVNPADGPFLPDEIGESVWPPAGWMLGTITNGTQAKEATSVTLTTCNTDTRYDNQVAEKMSCQPAVIGEMTGAASIRKYCTMQGDMQWVASVFYSGVECAGAVAKATFKLAEQCDSESGFSSTAAKSKFRTRMSCSGVSTSLPSFSGVAWQRYASTDCKGVPAEFETLPTTCFDTTVVQCQHGGSTKEPTSNDLFIIGSTDGGSTSTSSACRGAAARYPYDERANVCLPGKGGGSQYYTCAFVPENAVVDPNTPGEPNAPQINSANSIVSSASVVGIMALSALLTVAL